MITNFSVQFSYNNWVPEDQDCLQIQSKQRPFCMTSSRARWITFAVGVTRRNFFKGVLRCSEWFSFNGRISTVNLYRQSIANPFSREVNDIHKHQRHESSKPMNRWYLFHEGEQVSVHSDPTRTPSSSTKVYEDVSGLYRVLILGQKRYHQLHKI